MASKYVIHQPDLGRGEMVTEVDRVTAGGMS
jgi:hypothetical protein